MAVMVEPVVDRLGKMVRVTGFKTERVVHK
jgi:hypothetical protein